MGLDDAAAELRRQARANESDYRVLRRHFRHEVATLKRKGVLGKGVSARTALPTAGLTKVLNNLGDVLTGRRKAHKVSKKAAKSLREQGIPVYNGRAILAKSYKINRKTGRLTVANNLKIVERIRLRHDVEDQVDTLWAALGKNNAVTFSIFGNFSEVFMNDEVGKRDFLKQLLKYNVNEVPDAAVIVLPTKQKTTEFKHYRNEARIAGQIANEKARNKRSKSRVKLKRLRARGR